MLYLDKRVRVIADQLKLLRFKMTREAADWEYKRGLYLRPDEADGADTPWEPFDSRTMRWYADYAGTDRFEGRFEGHAGDFHGIPGSHYWFRTTLAVPAEFEGKNLWMRVRTQLEEWDDGKNPQFLIFINGEVTQGADMNHREVLLRSRAAAGEEIRVDVQAYTGTLRREFCFIVELFSLDEDVNGLYYDLLVPLQAFGRMAEDDVTRLRLTELLNDAVNMLDMRDTNSEAFRASVKAARQYLDERLYNGAGNGVTATCIGHTHIDVAWWWTVAQTREKAARSFATVLKLMDEYPGYKFMSSQPVLYYFLKQRYPEVYERIRERVREGRWEAEGAMWLEADCNLTSGESLVRQFMYGKRFFREEFGEDSKILWLPDVFGYSGALPQIMKKSGVDYFMTTKLSWNQLDRIPNDTFLWRGIDGSEVLTHLITTISPGQDPERSFFTTYNGLLHPDAVMGAWERYRNKGINNDVLISYGYGDGGGGPTRAMLETSVRMEKGIPGLPKVRQATARTFFTELDARVRDNKRLETWEGELYFEYHRGTYTSMARNKRGNRKSELMMMDLELLGVLSGDYPKEALRRFWRDTILLNQFHDILPGSSIAEVYETTKREYDALAVEACWLMSERMEKLAGEGDGVTAFNTLGFARDDIVLFPDIGCAALVDGGGNVFPVQRTRDGALAYIKDLPPKGFATFAKTDMAPPQNPFIIGENGIETPFYKVSFDETGRIASLYDKEHDRELAKPGRKLNELRLYEDKPMHYDNWDVDRYYTEKSWPVEDVLSMEWTETGPVRATLEVKWRISRSEIAQRIRFYAGKRRIDFETTADWKEHQHLLKAEFPVDIHTDEATFEIQFGSVTRKVHQNTSWDVARFESCGQRWMDLSEGHYGISLLNDCKYGHSCLDGVMALTLIKCGVEPNPNADVETHRFTYALFPHAETWRQAGTVREASMLNQPALVALNGRPGTRRSFLSVGAPNIVIETVKRPEDGDGVIVRLYESENARTRTSLTVPDGCTEAFETNLLEEVETALPIEDGKVALTVKPFEIKTILLR